MAIIKTAQTSELSLKVQTGVNASGQPVYRVRAYTNVKAAAADSDIFAIGTGIGTLQKYPVNGVSRGDAGVLVSQ